MLCSNYKIMVANSSDLCKTIFAWFLTVIEKERNRGYNKGVKTNIEKNVMTLFQSEEYEILLRNAQKRMLAPDYFFGRHRHREYELNYATAGSFQIGVDDRLVTVRKGEAILIAPGVPHSYMGDKVSSGKFIQLEYEVTGPKALMETIPALSEVSPYCIFTEFTVESGIMGTICHYNRLQNDQQAALLDFSFGQLFVLMSDRLNKRRKVSETALLSKTMQAVIQAIEQDYTEIDDLEELAQQYGVTARAVRKYFSTYIGIPPTRYITMLRLKKAKSLLWNSQKSLTEIALECGFGSPQYFSRVFHNYTGKTPSQYRTIWYGKIAECDDEMAELDK